MDDVFQLLDDSLVTIAQILGSRYVGAIRDSVEKWHAKLLLLQATLDQWLECQKTWMYLEPIFAAPDIQRQLPNESKVFKNVSSSWKEVMKQTNADPNCVKQGAAKGRREAFAKNNAMLDGVQRGLEEYLSTKRQAFPRFYFLSNDELLDILARSNGDPRAVQPYLRKCFDNLVRLEFSSANVPDIVAMISAEGERITLGRNLKARGNVEEWLRLVEKRMRVTLHSIIKAGVTDYLTTNRKEWVLVQKAQVVSVVGKIMWCRGSEEAVKNGELDEWYEENLSQLRDLAMLVRTGLQRLERKAIVALVIHDVHARDIIEELCQEKNVTLSSFSWKKQLRFYWEMNDPAVMQARKEAAAARKAEQEEEEAKAAAQAEGESKRGGDGKGGSPGKRASLTKRPARQAGMGSSSPVDDEWQVVVRQSASTIGYKYEYEGASGCLVITPLTDRCWMTITGALHLRLGANPAGPAGTGKTESSKDLAKALAVQCIVFNCSDQIGYKQMGKLFMGLSAAGAWTCLDEFNRIDIEVLSVVAQQMLVLRRARVAGLAEVNFEGVNIPVRDHHVIVTMNPGYAGRTELPDNLKVLFRPVAMMVPDYALIAEIMLLAEGFDTAKELSRKMVRMYKLSSEQLSQQRHYDYGMRAVKSVLVMAGQLKRDNASLSEDVVLIKACRDSNVPKFLAADLPLFHAIINDLFPGVHVPYSSHAVLQSALVRAMRSSGLQPVASYLAKVVQIFETQQVRFGVALVGPTGAGKTVGRRMLAKAMNDLHERGVAPGLVNDVITSVLNPKAVTMGELYGDYNVFTQEWSDGLASSIMRTASECDEQTRRWTVFDGPVDALWIENMNTVLDDNMTLCLANGERIKLRPQMRCFFEVQDLEVASPATVSRLGVVYMTPEALGWVPYVQSWIVRTYQRRDADDDDEEEEKETGKPATAGARDRKRRDSGAAGYVPPALLDHLFRCLELLLPPTLEFVETSLSRSVHTTTLNLVAACCSLFEAVFTQRNGIRFPAPPGTANVNPTTNATITEKLKVQMDRSVIFSVVWSLGGGLACSGDDREKFSDFFEALLEGTEVLEAEFPGRELVFSYCPEGASFFTGHQKIAGDSGRGGGAGGRDDRDVSNSGGGAKKSGGGSGGMTLRGGAIHATNGFVEWNVNVPDFAYDHQLPFFSLLVPTVDTVTYTYLVNQLLKTGRPTFVTGVTGTGKSSLLSRLLADLSRSVNANDDGSGNKNMEEADDDDQGRRGSTTGTGDSGTNANGATSGAGVPMSSAAAALAKAAANHVPILALAQIFSANTDSEIVQQEIENKLDKKNRSTLWGPHGAPIVLFIDDVNMPKVEEYGAQPPIELLRQLVDYGGFYNRQTLNWTNIDGCTTLLCAAPPGGGRSPLTQRIMRHFSVLSIPSADNDTMKLIFGSILEGFLESRNFPTEVRSLGRNAVTATIDVYGQIREAMRPTPSRAHYVFNLRDVAKVIQGLLQVSPETVNDPTTFVRLWVHEAMRVFHDRLVSAEDRLWFTQLAAEKCSRDFYQRWSYDELFNPEAGKGLRPPILFGAFYRPGERIYSEFGGISVGGGQREAGKDKPQESRSKGPPKGSPQALLKMLSEFQEEYNLNNKTPMDLVFFSDAIDHLSRIARILNQPRGSALLVGVGGSGRQSLTNLACEILEYRRFSISVTKGYGPHEFREDLKSIMFDAGVKGVSIAFMFNEIHIVHPSFLEDINSLLSSGEIPNIWLPEDTLRILESMRPVLKKLRVVETRENCLTYFQQRLRDNLHLVISLSPASKAFREKLRDYPALLNCTTIDWFSDWPSDALRAVARRLLSSRSFAEKNFDDTDSKGSQSPKGGAKKSSSAPSTFQTEDTDEGSLAIRAALVDACVLVHESVGSAAADFLATRRRHVYTTPKTFLDGIILYLQLLDQQGGKVESTRDRLAKGIDKLESTNQMVAEMQVKLTEMQPQLAKKAVETQALLEQVARETRGAEAIAARVSEDEAVVKAQQDEASLVQADAQRDLDRALPALEKAIKALNALEKKDITEMRSYATPPEAVQKVMECVCILLGHKPDWDTAKKIMQDSQFMTRLVEYDKDSIKRKIIARIGPYVEDDPAMAVDNVAKVSVAAKSLCMWVHSMHIYDAVAKDVEPKRERLREMNIILQEANDKLAVKQQELKVVTDKVAALKAKCDATVAEKERVTQEIERTKQRLVRAEKLTVGLADELLRWKKTVAQTGAAARALIGDVFLAAAAIGYCGAFTGDIRSTLMATWKQYLDDRCVPGTSAKTNADGFVDLVSLLSDPVQVREWQINGLPSDRVSTGNALMVTRGLRWPLLIDPQEQAKRWIKKTENANSKKTSSSSSSSKDANDDGGSIGSGDVNSAGSNRSLMTCQMNDENLLRVLETAVRSGRPLLLEDIGEEIQLSLDPVLLKQTFRQSGRTLIRLGDQDVDYDDRFRFYMTTKLHNPHYTPEVCIKVTVINFTVTQQGLEDQLLEHVVKKERPDVEKRKNALVVSMAGDRRQLDEIERKILRLLSASEGNILDDEDLVNTLASSKTTSSIIEERVVESAQTEIEVNALRDEYRPVAVRGALIYFVVADFVVVDPMYQYSLEYFIKLFLFCIDASRQRNNESESMSPQEVLVRRLETLQTFTTRHMYRQVCRGLFQRHTLTFSFLVCCSILRERGDVTTVEFGTMLRGAVDEGIAVAAREAAQEAERKEAEVKARAEAMAEGDADDEGVAKANTAAVHRHTKKDTVVHHFEAAEGIPPIPTDQGCTLTALQWATLMTLERRIHGSTFKGFTNDVIGTPENWQRWAQWSAHPNAHEVPMPGDWSERLTPFQQALVVKTFREDLAIPAVAQFIGVELGEQFTSAPPVAMADVYADTDARTPCVFVLSPGADPTSILLQFADSRRYGKRTRIISLGQGQGARAEALVSKSVQTGDWVLLQNCHLAKSWMPSLEKIVFELSEGILTDVDRNFRLFLTSFPAPYFPVSVLQTSIKMTNEPPRGLRSNMLRSFELAMPKEQFAGKPKSPLVRARRRILLSLAFFHAVVQERRKFGPLGWNIRYEFNDSDIVTSISTLDMFLQGIDVSSSQGANRREQPKGRDRRKSRNTSSAGRVASYASSRQVEASIPWDALLYVTGEINYGGRVTDDWDRRCLRMILRRSYTSDSLRSGQGPFPLSSSGVYHIPEDCSFNNIQRVLGALPGIDSPEVFGLHANAGVAAQEAATAEMFSTIMSMQPKSGTAGSGGGEKSEDEIVSALAAHIESEVPELLDKAQAGPDTFRIMPESGLVRCFGCMLFCYISMSCTQGRCAHVDVITPVCLTLHSVPPLTRWTRWVWCSRRSSPSSTVF